jgi:hypothetical protein
LDDVFVQEAVETEVIFGHAERDGGVVPELDFDLAKKAVGTAGKKVGAAVRDCWLLDVLPRDDLAEK